MKRNRVSFNSIPVMRDIIPSPPRNGVVIDLTAHADKVGDKVVTARKRLGSSYLQQRFRNFSFLLAVITVLWLLYDDRLRLSAMQSSSSIDNSSLSGQFPISLPDPLLPPPLDLKAFPSSTSSSSLSSSAPVKVEFTAPDLYVDIKTALNLDSLEHPAELRLLSMLLPLSEEEQAAMVENASMAGHMSIQEYIDKKEILILTAQKMKQRQQEEMAAAVAAAAAALTTGAESVTEGSELNDKTNGNFINERRKLSQLFPPFVPSQSPASSTKNNKAAPDAEVFQYIDPESEYPDKVRILVGVTSACCTQKAYDRRAAIRATWGQIAHSPTYNSTVDVKFFLAQPPDTDTMNLWAPVLEAEVAAHNDIVIIRGKEKYMNFPNKTIRLLRYMIASRATYSHVMKTDDDCYVRFGQLMEALHPPPPPPPPPPPSPPVKADDKKHTNTTTTDNNNTASSSLKLLLPTNTNSSTGTATSKTAEQLITPTTTTNNNNNQDATVERLSKEKGVPVHTDGTAVYDGRAIIDQHPGGQGFLDNSNGDVITLAQLAARSSNSNNNSNSDDDNDRDGRRRRDLLFFPSKNEDTALTTADIDMSNNSTTNTTTTTSTTPRLTKVYLGCVENKGGFQPIRDPLSKWYVSETELPNSAVPFAAKYAAGWGYVISRDYVIHAVKKLNLWEQKIDIAPAWYRPLHWEDVLVGLLLMDVAGVEGPEDHPGFRAAWRSCPKETVVRHLDVDAPLLMPGLYEQDKSALWDSKPIQCSSGNFLPGDYSGWRTWRDGLAGVDHL
jgi:hypothetical protein